jgi:hypothetical protein
LIDVNLKKEEILLKLSIEMKYIIDNIKIKYKFIKYFEIYRKGKYNEQSVKPKNRILGIKFKDLSQDGFKFAVKPDFTMDSVIWGAGAIQLESNAINTVKSEHLGFR